jgi:RND family efflux transporter MFP subunit
MFLLAATLGLSGLWPERSAAATRLLSTQPARTVASAVIVPAKVARLAFTISAPLKEVLVREGEQVQAGQTLMVLNTPELEYALSAAEAAYRGAQANALLQHAKKVRVYRKGKFLWVNEPREMLEMADRRVEQAQAALEVAQAMLTESKLIAPFAATVTTIAATPGEFLPADQTALTLATLDDWRIETTDLSERDIHRVQPGQRASVKIAALGVEVPARVMSIAPRAEILGGDVIFKVTLCFTEPPPPGLRWGMNAEVQIETP